MSPNAGAGEIIGLANQGTRDRQQQEKERLEGRQDTRDKIARDERRFYENERAKDRSQERLLAAENNAMNLQFDAQLAQQNECVHKTVKTVQSRL